MITMTGFNEIAIHIFDARFHNLSEELKTKASSMGVMSADYKLGKGHDAWCEV